MKPSSSNVRSHNVGTSDYSKHNIQPWDIWEEYNLNPWDADIIKRVLRTKEGDSRVLDYEKIIHICQYRIAALTADTQPDELPEKSDTETYCPGEGEYPPFIGIYDPSNGVDLIKVYSVFQSEVSHNNRNFPEYYAYLGYVNETHRHVYMDLSTHENVWLYKDKKGRYPKKAFEVSSTIDEKPRQVSMKIGGRGLKYELHDYIIDEDGQLLRYMGLNVDGQYVYFVLGVEPLPVKVTSDLKIFNVASQITLGEWQKR